MAKNNILGIEISYQFEDSENFEHEAYFDSIEDAIKHLETELMFQKKINYNKVKEELNQIEDELFNNGLSDIRKFGLLKRRAQLHNELDQIIVP